MLEPFSICIFTIGCGETTKHVGEIVVLPMLLH